MENSVVLIPSSKTMAIYVAIMATFIAIIAIYLGLASPIVSDNGETSSSVAYHATVYTWTTGDFEGRKTPAHEGINELVGVSHNTLYNGGQNMTRLALGVGSTAPILNISLCNASVNCETPVNDGTETFTLITSSGLNSSAGTYAALGPAGNWSVYKTFTAYTGNLKTNATRLTNDSGAIFAGNTFTLVTLQTNDQLTINWTIGVS